MIQAEPEATRIWNPACVVVSRYVMKPNEMIYLIRFCPEKIWTEDIQPFQQPSIKVVMIQQWLYGRALYWKLLREFAYQLRFYKHWRYGSS